MKRIFSLLLCFCFLFALTACSEKQTDSSVSETVSGENASHTFAESDAVAASDISAASDTASLENSTNEEIVYIALGDSIPHGYGLTDQANTCYPALLSEHIPNCVYHNLAVDGDTSEDLLRLLDTLDGLENADLITVTIGANNILGPAISAFSAVKNLYSDAAFSNLFSAMLGKDDADTASAALLLNDMKNALSDDAFQATINNGLTELKSDLPQILAKIRARNPNARLVFTTVYNPYRGLKATISGENGTSFDVGAVCKPYIEQLNAVLTDFTTENNLELSDIYTAFENSAKWLVNAGFDSSFQFSVDPHPNANGHILIAKTLAATLGYAYDQ